MKKIGIIGGGFTGTMTAVQLIQKYTGGIEIIIINEKENFNKGLAYSTYSDKHILNVVAGKMSAFPDKPDDFLDWIMARPEFKNNDRILISTSFLPRQLYGEYLQDIWQKAISLAKSKKITLTIINNSVIDLDANNSNISLFLNNQTEISVDYCIIATGNNIPRNPSIINSSFYSNKNYFQNPWKIESVQNIKSDLPILIVGNGLTMVDTIFGLQEQGFQGEIYSISPNGFNILPHRHSGLKYTKLTEELTDHLTLYEFVRLVNKHIHTVKQYGVSAEPIIDSLRLHTQIIWKNFTESEKRMFMSRLRHLWGVARHRIPMHSYEKIQKLQVDGKLHIHSGKIIDFNQEGNGIKVDYFDKKEQRTKSLIVSRIINCTGPETDLIKLENNFLNNCLKKGILNQDELKLGIVTNTETFQIINADGKSHSNLFTLGSNLKGELWESTAVNELRGQAELLATILKSQFGNG